MNCLRARQEIKAYIDGELRPWTRWLVARHIATCEDCRREMQQMTELTNEVANVPSVSAPSGLRDKVMGSLTFQPASRAPRVRSHTRGLATGAAGLVGVVLLAAIIMPMFNRAKESGSYARYLAAQRAQPAGIAPKLSPSMVACSPKPIAEAKDFDTTVVGKVQSEAEPSAPQMIIKTAELGVQVRSFQRASDEAVTIAKSSGGYVTDTSASSDAGISTEGSMTLRVPANAFERTMNRLTKLGTVTARSITGEDVTGESVDLESRLRNLRAEERQYLEIMNRAKRIPDVVTVTGELSRVRGEIEEAQGRLKYLKTSAAMSTINLSLSEKARPKPHKSALGTSLGNAVSSLRGTLNGLASLLIWLAVYSPFWALPIAVWLYTRRRAAGQLNT